MSVKCGNCKRNRVEHPYHDTIAQVRECYAVGTRPTTEPDQQLPIEPVRPISPKQVAFLEDLLSVRVWPDSYTLAELKAMSHPQASSLITLLKEAEYKNQEINFPAGRYALPVVKEDDDTDNDIVFYEVETWKDRFNGKPRLKVTMLLGAPGDFAHHRVRDSVAQRILARIAANPKEAMLLFGEKTEVCGSCGSPLTNKKSREARIGPVCAKKPEVRSAFGW